MSKLVQRGQGYKLYLRTVYGAHGIVMLMDDVDIKVVDPHDSTIFLGLGSKQCIETANICNVLKTSNSTVNCFLNFQL